MDNYPVKSGVEINILEAVLAAYRQILGNPSVSPDDDFFELGGDSFQAMDLMAALEEATGTQISAAMIFAFPTVTELTRAITKIAGVSS